MSLIGAMIWILAEDHHPDLIEGCVSKGIKDLAAWRKDPMIRLFLEQERTQILHIGLLKLFAELGEPGRLELDGGRCTHGRVITRPIGARLGGSGWK